MKMKELREKNDVELGRMLAELREELHGYRFRVAVDQLKQVREIRRVRGDIARIMTLMKERKIVPKKDAKAAAVTNG